MTDEPPKCDCRSTNQLTARTMVEVALFDTPIAEDVCIVDAGTEKVVLYQCPNCKTVKMEQR